MRRPAVSTIFSSGSMRRAPSPVARRLGSRSLHERGHELRCAGLGVKESGVVRAFAADLEIPDDIVHRRLREEPPHGIRIESIEVAGIQFPVVRHEELLSDAPAEARVHHVLEAMARPVCGAEIEIVQAIQELLPGKLMDIRLKREIDQAVFVADPRSADDFPHCSRRHSRQEVIAQDSAAEMEVVPRAIPYEPLLVGAFAVPAQGLVFLEDQVVPGVEEVGEGQPRHAATQNEIGHALHTCRSIRSFS